MYYYQQYQGRSQKSAMGRGWACAEGLETQLRDPGAKYPCSEILNFFFSKIIWFTAVESRTESSRLRPRTQKKKKKSEAKAKDSPTKADPLEAKDGNAQGQGPRTQAHVFSKKKEIFRRSPKKEHKKVRKFSARFLAFSNIILTV